MKQAGDIHPNPGPIPVIQKAKLKKKLRKNLHLLHIIISACLIINIVLNWNEVNMDESSGNTKELYMHTCKNRRSITNQLAYLITNRKKKLFINTYRPATFLSMLLILLSGDVHINPGPMVRKVCCKCCNEVTDNCTYLQCETCNQLCHEQCDRNLYGKNKNVPNDKRYSWICPNRFCKPNYNLPVNNSQYNVQDGTIRSHPNRYSILTNMKRNIEANMHKKPTISSSTKNIERKKEDNLWKALPKIKSRDYIGIDKCRACHKNIGEIQQAISCDSCQRWIHRKCSDMSTKKYKENQLKKQFNWNCNMCRQNEEICEDLPDISKLKSEELPEMLENNELQENEILILHMNVRSAINKFEELEYICKELNPDILCCTETWMDDSLPETSNIPTGYRVKRKDRSSGFKQKYNKRNGGGIAVYYKEHMKVDVKDYMSDDVEEIFWLHIKTKESFMLGTIYRASYTDTMKTGAECKIEENIRKATEISSRLIIHGDYNIDLLNQNNPQTQRLNEFYADYGLKQYVTKPTRIDKESGRPTLIDHIWANKNLNMIKKAGTFTGISDHFGTYMILNRQKERKEKKSIKYRSYKDYDQNNFTHDLQKNLVISNVNKYIHEKDVNRATEELIKTMQGTAQIHAPLKEVNIGGDAIKVPWQTDELNNKLKEKNGLLTDYFYYGTSAFKNRIKKLSNEITHMKRKLKRMYVSSKLKEANGDGKKTWKLLNFITGREASQDTVEPENINQKKANQYNTYFATVGTEIQKELNFKPHAEQIKVNGGFIFKPRTADDIIKLIDKIKPDVAVGDDFIGGRLIKDAKMIIAPILTQIINLGYETSTFPDTMKSATIKAIHKKKSTEDIENYRPISILPTLSKIFERDASDQMMEFFGKSNKLSKHQHAYQKCHSTITCLFEVVNYLYKMADRNRYSAIVSLDLSKAFDSIDHTLLLNKLATLDVSEKSITWVKSYLTERKQITKFNKVTSSEETVKSGVPQGSILGPLLFLCFTNDLPSCFEDTQKILSYADDTQILVDADSKKELKCKIENVITIAQSWYDSNSMKNNIGKTEILILKIGKWKKEELKIKVIQDKKPVIIKPSSEIKVLGIVIDSKLNWDAQVKSIRNKSLNVTRNLHRINHTLPIKQRIQLYTSLTEPHFSYGDVIWGGCGVVNSQKLQIVQNFAAKSITGNKKRDSATKSLEKLKFLKLYQRRNIHECVFAHKSLTNNNPENICTTYQNQQSSANTRLAASHKLIPPKHRTSKYQHSPLYRTVTSWNQCNLATFGDVPKHKRLLQKQLITITYNTGPTH